ncbi:hypothetical protein ASG90_01635 [Nocardioides sp. Soil797]|nr:hypothetical protein ASG90_01635 [Nocardioides sp. Soil797]
METKSRRTRRGVALIGAALAASLVATGCSGASSNSGDDSDDTIRVALIPPTTGALAQFGTDTVAAWKFAAKELNDAGGVDGRKMEIKVYETDGTVSKTLSEARRAATKDGADFIGAVMTGPENQALASQLEALDVLNFNATGNDDELIGEACNKFAFRSVTSSSMDLRALAGQVSELPEKKWAIMAVDYSIGHSAAKTFKGAVEDAGGEVVDTQYAPLGTTDFGTYISQLKESGADGLFVVEYGADAVAFVQQGDQYKLFDDFGNVVGMNMVSEPLFDAIGKQTVGFLGNVNYDASADNEANRAFVKAWTNEHGQAPYYVQSNTYLAAQMLIEGVRKAGTVEPAKVREALSGLAFDSIVGPVEVRAGDHQLLQPTYVGKVRVQDGGFGWDILATAPASETSPEVSPDCSM